VTGNLERYFSTYIAGHRDARERTSNAPCFHRVWVCGVGARRPLGVRVGGGAVSRSTVILLPARRVSARLGACRRVVAGWNLSLAITAAAASPGNPRRRDATAAHRRRRSVAKRQLEASSASHRRSRRVTWPRCRDEVVTETSRSDSCCCCCCCWWSRVAAH